AIEQVRDLQRELGFRAMSAHPKIGIVNDADLLTLQAQNALLKTLEEPGGDTVLILVAVNAAALAETILSRCQRVGFDPLPTADLAAELPELATTTSLRNLESTYGTIVALRQNANRNVALVRMLMQLASRP